VKVLWIHQNLVTGRQAGNNRAVNIAAALIEAGAEVELIASGQSYFGDAARPGVETDGRLTLHRLPIADSKQNRAAAYLEFNRAAFHYARRLQKPDIVFCSSPPLPQVATSAALARLWNIPWALEVRDLWPAFVIEGGLLEDGIIGQAMRLLESFAYRSAGALVSVSSAFNPYLEKMTDNTIVTAPSGGDRRLLTAPVSLGHAWKQQQGIDGPMVLYAGSFNAAYGIPALLEAAARSNATWVFAGNGADQHLVEAAGVRYLGSVPRTELFPAILAADVGINSHSSWPLLDTCITGKLFDYMAAGVPVLSTGDGQIGEIIRAAGCGLVTKDINAGVAELLQHPGKGVAGRQWLARNMHADTMARRVADAILNTRRRGCLRHVPGAFADMLTGKSQRVLRATYGTNRQAVIRDEFSRWAETGDAPEPLAIPDLLS
jgi:glycosyltransferase involved in cell wall biosynthesis